MEEISRSEHLKWCKRRALEYVDRGELQNAIASMASDLRKHSAWQNSEGVTVAIADAMLFMRTPDQIRRWVEGFN